ncbi:MAG TPA: CBS domain-containing protein [Longimicrobiales bacterium]|nr:CBS domain-containing protein [Longimicrobiales bacterium]
MKARELMSSDLECVTRQDSLSRAAQIMKQADIGAVPVVEDQNSMRLVGVITDRDIAVRHVAGDNADDCTVGDHMTDGRLFTCSPDDEVDQVLRTMKSQQVRRVPVVEGERLVGIIAQADIATDLSDDSRTGEVVERISEPGRGR